MKALTPTSPDTPPISQPPPSALTLLTMATDYDFSDDFTSAQYLPPGRGPILIEYNPPPLPPQRPSLRDLFYPATPPHIDQQIPGFVFGRFLLAFLHDCSVLISDCWHRRVKIRSIVSLAVCAVVVFVIRKGMWDVAVLKSELGEAKRQLWQVQENLFQCRWHLHCRRRLRLEWLG